MKTTLKNILQHQIYRLAKIYLSKPVKERNIEWHQRITNLQCKAIQMKKRIKLILIIFIFGNMFTSCLPVPGAEIQMTGAEERETVVKEYVIEATDGELESMDDQMHYARLIERDQNHSIFLDDAGTEADTLHVWKY